MALWGDEVPYTSDISPYGSPHVCGENIAYVGYEDFHLNRPKKFVRDVQSLFKWMGTC